MSHSPTDWLPAIGILIAGVIAGLVLLRGVMRRRGGQAIVAEDREYADLLARRDALIEQIRETPDAPDRADLEREAARVLRQLDRRPPISVAPSPRRPVAPSPVLRGFFWGAGTVAVLAIVAFLVTRSATERPQGGSLTGGGPPRTAASDPELAQLQRQLDGNPNDIDLRLDLARVLLARERLMEVFEHTQFVLQRQPNHPRALSYQALVRLAMGESETALQMLQEALSRDPDSIEARVHLALVYATIGNSAAAEQTVEETIRRHPQQRERLTALLQQIRGSADSAADRVELVIELAPGKRLTPGATLFVVARPEGVSEGAPIAVKSLRPASFPLTVSLGPEDSMMGGKLTERLRIEARADADGDPLTRTDADPRASIDGVSLGATGVRLVLR